MARLRLIQGAVAALLLLGVAAMASGCGDDYVFVCSPLPTEAIKKFEVTTFTGDDGSDADIEFCIELKGGPKDYCATLGGVSDPYQKGAIDTLTADLTVEAGQLSRFFLRNRGGAGNWSLDGDDWALIGVEVLAQTASGTWISLLDVASGDIDIFLEAGETFDPDCAF